MIVQSILSDMQWTPYGIQCNSEKTASIVNLFMREAILDRHITVSKIAGFAIKTNNTFRPYAGTYIARHKQIGDSYPEVMLNLQDKVFINTGLYRASTLLTVGDNTMDKNVFGDLRDITAEALYTNNRICRCLDKEAILECILVYDCGYMNMAQSSKVVKSEYFPCTVDFYIGDFFRVLPPVPGSTLVQIRYYNGATEKNLREIMEKWFVWIQTGGIKGDEKLWLQSFVL